MPNRGIKESICTSKSIAALSAEAERLFYRLLVNCDDYGRMEADPDILIPICFPRIHKQITDEQMISWLTELSKEMLVLYSNNGKTLLEFANWKEHNRIRARYSKFPSPTDKGSVLLSYDNTCKQMTTDVLSTRTRDTRHEHETRDTNNEQDDVVSCERDENLKTVMQSIQQIKPITKFEDQQMITEMADSYPRYWLIEAIKIAVQQKARNFGYVDGILSNWKKFGYKDTEKPWEVEQGGGNTKRGAHSRDRPGKNSPGKHPSQTDWANEPDTL